MPFYLILCYKLVLKLKEKPLTRKCCKNPRSMLVKTIFQGATGLVYKIKKFCSLYSREKNNIFLAKIVEYNVFLATRFATSIFVF